MSSILLLKKDNFSEINNAIHATLYYSILYYILLPEGVGTTTTFLGVMATCGGSEGVAEVIVELTTVATVGTAKKLKNNYILYVLILIYLVNYL